MRHRMSPWHDKDIEFLPDNVYVAKFHLFHHLVIFSKAAMTRHIVLLLMIMQIL